MLKNTLYIFYIITLAINIFYGQVEANDLLSKNDTTIASSSDNNSTNISSIPIATKTTDIPTETRTPIHTQREFCIREKCIEGDCYCEVYNVIQYSKDENDSDFILKDFVRSYTCNGSSPELAKGFDIKDFINNPLSRSIEKRCLNSTEEEEESSYLNGSHHLYHHNYFYFALTFILFFYYFNF